MKLILFDIDGTLIDTAGAGTRSLNSVFLELFSIKDAFKKVTLAGKTDIQIFKEGLRFYGIRAGKNIVEKIKESYLNHLKKEINNNSKHVKPGIINLLEKLSDNSNKTGILTGNIVEGAEIKLDSLNIWHYFEEGAFGSDHEDRVKLLPIVIKKFYNKYAFRFTFKDCVVIGDTPRDVSCAKPYGARTIAVATGPYSYDELLSAGADIVFNDLSDTEVVLKHLY